MFLGRKNQYYENAYTTKLSLQIQCNPYQITNGIVHRTRTKNFTIRMETQMILNSQSNLEKEKWSWRIFLGGAAGNPRVPRLLPGTLGNFPGCL